MQNELKPMYLCWTTTFSDSERKYEKCIKLSDFLSSQIPLISLDAYGASLRKELVHALSCAHIESWMHLGSLESPREARVGLGYRLSNSQLDKRTLTINQIFNLSICTHGISVNEVLS